MDVRLAVLPLFIILIVILGPPLSGLFGNFLLLVTGEIEDFLAHPRVFSGPSLYRC